MTDRIQQDIGTEEFVQKLLDTGALYLPAGSVIHNLAMAGWLNSSALNVRRNLFHRTDGGSVPSVPICGRDLTTVTVLAKWIETQATPQGRNPNLSRSKEPCAPAKTRKKRAR